MPLTDAKIKNIKPKDKPFKMFDGGGMFLQVTPAGGKWWRLKYSIGGKSKLLSLGIYPEISLKDARKAREDARELIAKGSDPSLQRQTAKAAVKAAVKAIEVENTTTFELVAREWHSKKTVKATENHRAKIMSRLEKNIFPAIGKMPIGAIRTPDILKPIEVVAARGANDLAHRLGQYVHRVFIYARACGLVERIHSDYLAKSLEPVQTSHYKTIIDSVEIGHLLRAIDTYNGYPSVAYALKIMPYVFVRSRELRGALWSEIDFDSKLWTIPASRMKMNKAHIVPLAGQVIGMFTALREYSTGDLLFPSPNNSGRCISDMSLLNGLRRLGYDKEQMTIHGFRAMASTLLNEQKYVSDWIERQLSHCEKDDVRKAYNHAQYLDERKIMMQAWADYLDSLRDTT